MSVKYDDIFVSLTEQRETVKVPPRPLGARLHKSHRTEDL